MKRLHLLPFLLLLVALAGAKERPSTDELRQMLTRKQYKPVMREVARAMALKGDDAAGYDRAELLLIRGEAQLGLRLAPAAARSFREAAEAATDADRRAAARALGLLLERSEHLLYTPKAVKAGGVREIDIVLDRQAALDTLLADVMAALEPRVAAAAELKRIPDVLELARAVEQAEAVELTATGSAARTKPFKTELASRVETLLDDALREMEVRANQIEESALSVVAIPPELARSQPAGAAAAAAAAAPARARRRGITTADEAALTDIMATCREIVTRSREVADQLGGGPDRFNRASDAAIRLSSKAGAILRGNYARVLQPPDPGPTDPAPKSAAEPAAEPGS